MNFKEIIQSNTTKHDKLAQILKSIVDSCGIKPYSYFILGSYAIREQREINDLDLNMDSEEFHKLEKCTQTDKNNKISKIEEYNNQIRWFFDLTDEYKKLVDPNANDFSIEIFKKKPMEGFPDETFSLQYLTEHDGLDKDNYGHQYFSLKTLLRWKKTMNRPKDQSDIEIIEKMIHSGGYYHKYMKYKMKYLKEKEK